MTNYRGVTPFVLRQCASTRPGGRPPLRRQRPRGECDRANVPESSRPLRRRDGGPSRRVLREARPPPAGAATASPATGRPSRRAGLRLDTQGRLADRRRQRPGDRAGRPGRRACSSRRSTASDGLARMPPKGKLTDREIAALTKWIKDGAADPRDGGPVRLGGTTVEEARKWWAFQPVKRPPVPKQCGRQPRRCVHRRETRRAEAVARPRPPTGGRCSAG